MGPATESVGSEAADNELTAQVRALIPIAVVIAAGCERCAASMVERALRLGTPRPLIERTLATVAYVRSRTCLVEAVGSEVVARMDEPLKAGTRALRASSQSMGRTGGGR